jgi:hypothetical protein
MRTTEILAEALARGPEVTPTDQAGPDWLLVTVVAVAAVVIVLAGVYVGGRAPTREIRADQLTPGMTLVRNPGNHIRPGGERVVAAWPSQESGGDAILVRTRWSPRWVWTLDPAERVEIKTRRSGA